MSTEYTLHYFDSRGLAEPIRIMLSYAGAKWKDQRVPIEPMPVVIPEDLKSRLPYGQLPILEFDGELLSQSLTIERFLARKFNLIGKGEIEAAKCDEIMDAATDFRHLFTQIWFEKDEEKKAQIRAEATQKGKERFLSRFNQVLVDNGGKYLVGSGLTWADIAVAHFIQNFERVLKVPLVDDFPALQDLVETVFNTPGIKEYAASRPDTMF